MEISLRRAADRDPVDQMRHAGGAVLRICGDFAVRDQAPGTVAFLIQLAQSAGRAFGVVAADFSAVAGRSFADAVFAEAHTDLGISGAICPRERFATFCAVIVVGLTGGAVAARFLAAVVEAPGALAVVILLAQSAGRAFGVVAANASVRTEPLADALFADPSADIRIFGAIAAQERFATYRAVIVVGRTGGANPALCGCITVVVEAPGAVAVFILLAGSAGRAFGAVAANAADCIEPFAAALFADTCADLRMIGATAARIVFATLYAALFVGLTGGAAAVRCGLFTAIEEAVRAFAGSILLAGRAG